MTTRDMLFDGPAEAPLTLAHGAGVPMDSPFMAAMARGGGGPRPVRRPLRVSRHGGPPRRRQKAPAGPRAREQFWDRLLDVARPAIAEFLSALA